MNKWAKIRFAKEARNPISPRFRLTKAIVEGLCLDLNCSTYLEIGDCIVCQGRDFFYCKPCADRMGIDYLPSIFPMRGDA